MHKIVDSKKPCVEPASPAAELVVSGTTARPELTTTSSSTASITALGTLSR